MARFSTPRLIHVVAMTVIFVWLLYTTDSKAKDKPADFASLNNSTPSKPPEPLVRRAGSSYLNALARKGCGLISYMRRGVGPDQPWARMTNFTDPAALSNNGWHCESRVSNVSSAELNHLFVEMGWPMTGGVEIDCRHLFSWRAVARNGGDPPPLPPDRRFTATTASFKHRMDTDLGLIIARGSYGSRYFRPYNPSLIAPPLDHWSDIVYLLWERLFQDRPVEAMTYVVQEHITNDDTLDIIEEVLELRGVDPTKLKWRQPFPGYILDVDREEDAAAVSALIASPNGRGLAYLLAQHAYPGAFNARYDIKTVIIFTSPPSLPDDEMHLLFETRRWSRR